MKKILTSLVLMLLVFYAVLSFAEESGSENPIEDMLKALTDPMEEIISPIMQLGDIVVTSTKVKEKLGAQSSSVTVLGEKEFDAAKEHTVKSALKNEMGLDVVQTGAFSGQTSVFMRGTNSNHTAVMIDGIRVYDAISPNGAFNLAHLTLDNIERIEIARGPHSTLYGSDAIGGVINIITKKAEGPFFTTSFETGAFSTFRESFSAGAVVHGLHYSIGGSNVKSRGISQAQAKNSNPELDGYERYALSGRFDYDIKDNFTVGGTFRHDSTLFDYDEGRRDDVNLNQRNFQTIFTSHIDHQPFDLYSYYIKLGWMHNFRRDQDSNNGNQIDYLRDWYKGYAFKFDYRNNFHLFDFDTFTIGYEYTEEMGDFYWFADWGTGNAESDMPKVFSHNSALYLQNRLNYRDRLTATQGMRVDHHTHAGTNVTYKVDGSYLFPTGTKLRGGFATGLKAPTLYQLHAPSIPRQNFWGAWMFGFDGGNASLDPETSESYELGFDQYLFGEKFLFNFTYFHQMLHEVIGTTTDELFNTSEFTNMGKAHSHGIETGTRIKPLENFEMKGSYTYNFTKDYSTDRPLLRRPEHKYKINIFWTVVPKWDVNLELRYSGLRYGRNVDKLKPYIVADFVTSYKLLDHLEIYLKINNAFDQRYEEVRGYGMSPFAVYAGTKAEF